MQRYENTVEYIRHNGDGKRRYETMLYPNIPHTTSDIYFIAKQLDRLDNIAHAYYGDPRLWWVIKISNNLPGGTLQIPAGKRIRIPYPLTSTQLSNLLREKQF